MQAALKARRESRIDPNKLKQIGALIKQDNFTKQANAYGQPMMTLNEFKQLSKSSAPMMAKEIGSKFTENGLNVTGSRSIKELKQLKENEQQFAAGNENQEAPR